MALTIRVYNHNASTHGANEVSVVFHTGNAGYATRVLDMTQNIGTAGYYISNITPSVGTSISATVSERIGGYEVVCWHYSLNGTSGTSPGETYELIVDANTSGTLHLWPEMRDASLDGGDEEEGGDGDELEWEVVQGESFDSLTSPYSVIADLGAYKVYQIDFSCPIDGQIKIYSNSGIDTLGFLCEGGTEFDTVAGVPTSYITYNDDGGTNGDFVIFYNVTADTQYTLYVRMTQPGFMGKATITLEPPVGASTIEVSNAVIGQNPVIVINKYHSGIMDTITYDWYGITGTIASKTTAYEITDWTIPTTFYAKIPNATSGELKITCTSYDLDGWVEVGSNTTTITVQVREDLCAPALYPTVKDIKEETIALTGDENTLIRYISMVEYDMQAAPQNHATIVEYWVRHNNKSYNSQYGVIDDVENGTFIFEATDSRGLTTEVIVKKDIVEYIKPTCYQRVRMTMEGETFVTISGSYFNGSFGVASNTIKLEVRYAEYGGEYTNWIEVTNANDQPSFINGTYKFEAELLGFDYRKRYTFQCRITDRFYTVPSQSYTARWMPIFDWSESDFNFNVPVNMNATEFGINGETVIRHNEDANNIVISATGANMYLRPGGTNDTSGEVRISSQGFTEIKGDLIVDGINILDVLREAGII